MTMRRTIRFVWLSACLAVSAAPALAQTPMPAPPAGPITLAEGVRTSLAQARFVLLANEQVKADAGAIRQAKGAFDVVFQIGPLFEHREDPIENTQFFDQERVKRGFAKGLRDGFGAVAKSLGDQLAKGRGDLPLCPIDVDNGFSSYTVTLPGSVVPVPLCRPASLALGSAQSDDSNVTDPTLQLRQALPFDPLSTLQLQLLLSNALRAQISTVALNAREEGNEALLTLQQAAELVEEKAGLVFFRLGDLPKLVDANTVSLSGSLRKALRSGSFVQFTATFDGRATLYRNKPIDPTFGGSDVRNRFGNKLELAWTQPLRRGRGSDTVEAAERAAKKTLEADQFNFQQTASDQALTTSDAYFQLIAAQDSLRLVTASLATQRQLLDTTTRLVAAGEVPNADLARVRANIAQRETNIASARLDILDAQAALADAMALPAGSIVGLTAADTFPVAPAELDLDALSQQAMARRSDLKAFSAFRDTSRILLTAARLDTRSRWDVRASGGFGQAFFSPTFHTLGDENGVHLTNDDYREYYNLGGITKAFKQKWEPLASVVVTIELPWGNNTRLGRFDQARATARQSDIRLADLGRTIQNNVPMIAEDVRKARAEWIQRQDAVVDYENTWDATQRLRAAGELSLIDTFFTEQQLTDARLALVQAKRAYASAVAHFRRETGTLVDFPQWSTAQPNLAGIVATP
jgi:outer membrane protein TolC